MNSQPNGSAKAPTQAERFGLPRCVKPRKSARGRHYFSIVDTEGKVVFTRNIPTYKTFGEMATVARNLVMLVAAERVEQIKAAARADTERFREAAESRAAKAIEEAQAEAGEAVSKAAKIRGDSLRHVERLKETYRRRLVRLAWVAVVMGALCFVAGGLV